MSIMPDHWIRRMAPDHGMIEPFVESQRREGVISYGLSSYGYDARVADEFKIFTNVDNALVDPEELLGQPASSPGKAGPASSRRTPSRWRTPSNISASRATCW